MWVLFLCAIRLWLSIRSSVRRLKRGSANQQVCKCIWGADCLLILYLSIVYDIQLRLEQKHGFIIHKRVNFTHHFSESSLNADTHFYTFDPE